MAKVAVQLGLRAECERAVETMQKVVADLRRHTRPISTETVFSALALRYQLDLDQLLLPVAATYKSRMHATMDTIVRSKAYLAHAERAEDVQLQRDALKRIMNALVEVGAMAQLDKEEEEAAKADAAGASKRKKTAVVAQPLAKPSDILRYSPKEMDALEVRR